MAIAEGKKAPEFTLTDQDGKKVSLADFKGKDVVLYFYPKDDTPGCTKEACGFRDDWKTYQKRGAVVPWEKVANPFSQPPSNLCPGAGPMQPGLWFRTVWKGRRETWSRMKTVEEGAVAFFGDSITQGWSTLAKDFPGMKVSNRGISGDTTRGLRTRLKDVLDKAGVKPGAVQVRFKGLEEPVVADAPHFMKSLDIDHARDGEVMIAYAMNGEQLPLVNGFPLRLVVPGWYATYWVKMLNDIEVLDQPDTNYWTKVAYTIPDTPHASMKPGETDVKMIPINRMVPRSFATNIASGSNVKAATPTALRGIAFGGDCGVASVDLSIDRGKSWQQAQLGTDEGKYGFRQWQANLTLPAAGAYSLLIRCTNSNGVVQPDVANWNPAGFMRNVMESINIVAV